MPGATEFHLIRHGEHDLLGRRLAGRMPGVDLNRTGSDQAEALGRSLAATRRSAIVSSPRDRARQTAAPLAARVGLEVTIDDAFDEIDFGDWTGAAFDDLRDDPRWHAFNSFRSGAGVPGGETMPAAQARAVAGILAWRRRVPDGVIAVFSHSDIIKAVLAWSLGIPLDLARRIEIAPAAVSVLRLYDEDCTVVGINCHCAQQ